MFRFLVFVAKPDTGSGQREALGEDTEWSFDRTEAEGEVMPTVRGMVQAMYAVLDVDAVREWGPESDESDTAPDWAADLLAHVDLVGVAGSWVEVDGKPFAFVAAVEEPRKVWPTHFGK